MKQIKVEFPGVTLPIRFWREEYGRLTNGQFYRGIARCSIPTLIYHHSADGIEWAYEGWGRADCALNILHALLPVGCDGMPAVKLWVGRCSQVAWDLHQQFKVSWIAGLAEEGGEFAAADIDEWLVDKLVGWITNQQQKLSGSIAEDCDD